MSEYRVVSALSESQTKCVHELFKNEWWTKDRTYDEVVCLLEHSLSVALVQSSTEALVAYSRVITDRVRYALICDVIVAQACRGNKVGRLLIESILSHPELERVTTFELKCLPEMMPFYEKFGFTPTTAAYQLMVHKR